MLKRIVKGKLEVICGSMFSGKSEELIRRIRRAEFAQQKTCVFKHRIDDRMTIDYIHAHNGDKYKAIALENPADMHLFVTDDVRVVAIDEIQFFSDDIIPIVLTMMDAGKRVIAGGLDLDFRGVPFGTIPTLMALADSVTKLNAVCMICGNDAHFSQRLINGHAAKFDDPIILIGAQDCYQARCRDCFIIDRSQWSLSKSKKTTQADAKTNKPQRDPAIISAATSHNGMTTLTAASPAMGASNNAFAHYTPLVQAQNEALKEKLSSDNHLRECTAEHSINDHHKKERVGDAMVTGRVVSSAIKTHIQKKQNSSTLT